MSSEIDELQIERDKLKEILEKYQETIEYYNLKIDMLFKLYRDNPTMLESSLKLYNEKLRLMEKSIDKPYFARIDFLRKGENVEKLYIGKVGVMDEDSNNITIDWRAPIASIYYDSNIGKTSYEAPEGRCEGELLLKRQYDIENRYLKSFQDVDTVSNDELLKPYLNASADNRLKNIVSTIQKEQNDIIRENINKNMIIQGVAGSGKTTVALHRIAYLVYNNRKNINPNQFLVIGPNKFFVNYISGVLPDLEVENVNQLTYEELCSDFINEKLTLINEEKNLICSISNEEELTYEKFKLSMEFKDLLDKYILDFDKNIIPKSDIEIKGYKLISRNLIQEMYNSIEDSIVYDSILKKIERTKLLLEKYIEDNNEKIIEDVKKQASNEDYNKLKNIEKEIKSGCKNSLKKYFSNLIPNILDIYIDYLKNVEINESFFKKIDENIKNLKSQKVEFEDLSALIYLKLRIIGNEKYDMYRQVAIDEAQDFGEFSFYALKCLLKKSTFSIFGDLAQSIYQYRGMNDWKNIIKNTFNDECEIKYLLKSYRTTTEIMNSANNITEYIKLNTAVPVIRHGKKVKYISYKNEDEQITKIKEILDSYKKEDYKTVAIICKEKSEATIINEKLRKENIIINNITDLDTQYVGGICTITSYLAKGLEFDGVIMADASEKKYDVDKSIDMKLVYVSMTRPLHELNVLYKDSIIKPLKSEIE